MYSEKTLLHWNTDLKQRLSGSGKGDLILWKSAQALAESLYKRIISIWQTYKQKGLCPKAGEILPHQPFPLNPSPKKLSFFRRTRRDFSGMIKLSDLRRFYKEPRICRVRAVYSAEKQFLGENSTQLCPANPLHPKQLTVERSFFSD